MKKSIKWSIIVIAGILVIAVVAALIDGDLDSADSKTEPVAKVEDTTKPDETADDSWDDIKGDIIGKSDKDFKGLTKAKPSDVRNDKTGKWKITKISENVDFEEYALSYKDEYMKENEIHFIVNFNYHTTTRVSVDNSLIHVDVMEYTDKEEHDASTLGNGMLLKSYVVYPDGDIEEVE